MNQQKEFLKLGSIKQYQDKQTGDPYKKVVVAVDNIVEIAKRVAQYRGQNRYMYMNLLENNPQWDPAITWDATSEPVQVQQRSSFSPRPQYQQQPTTTPAPQQGHPSRTDDLPF